MYERLLNKQTVPTIEDLISYCGENAELFVQLNDYLSNTYGTTQEIRFPYGNKYGWGVTHRKGRKLVCDIFAEKNAFTVMMRLSNKQYENVDNQVSDYAKQYIDNKYPCGDGGWIHYRVINKEQLKDIQTLLSLKCSK